MQDVFHGSATYPAFSEGPVVTIGNFDGVHRGHQVLLNRTLELAKTLNRPACAFTFTLRLVMYCAQRIRWFAFSVLKIGLPVYWQRVLTMSS